MPAPLSTTPAALPLGIAAVPRISPLTSGTAIPSGISVPTNPLVLNGTNSYFSTQIHQHTTAFSVAVRVTQRAGTRGYLFAQSRISNADLQETRFYGLYSGTSSFTLYYRASGQDRTSSVRFSGISVSDGTAHTVVLSISGATASVVVDGAIIVSRSLVGQLDLCDNCVFVIGGRAANGGTSAHHLVASISDAGIYPWTGRTSSPPLPHDPFADPSPPAHDLLADLNGNQHASLLSAGQVTLKGGASFGPTLTEVYPPVTFDGSGGALLLTQPAFVPPYTVVTSLRAAGADSQGIIFARTDAAGLPFSVLSFTSSSQNLVGNGVVTWEHRVGGQAEVVTFEGELGDGRPHDVVLIIQFSGQNAFAQLIIDNRSQLRNLSGVPEDCGIVSPMCLTYIGTRAANVRDPSGGHPQLGLNGTIFTLLHYSSALETPPVIAPGIERFEKTERRYVAGRNEGGTFAAGTTPLSLCIERCLNDTACLSFDAGRPQSPAEGACFLSHTTQVNGTLRTSDLYDYFELTN